MIKYFIVAISACAFFWLTIVSIALMGGGSGATLKRDYWIFAGSFFGVLLLVGVFCFFWFFKKDFYFALFILVSCLIPILYIGVDMKKDFLLFLSVTPVVGGEGEFYTTKDSVLYGTKVLAGLDPQSFHLLTLKGEDVTSLSYVADKNGIYILAIGPTPTARAIAAHKESFVVLAYGYATDDSTVYFEGNKVENANPKTFVVENSSNTYYDASDSIHHYLKGVLVTTPAQ